MANFDFDTVHFNSLIADAYSRALKKSHYLHKFLAKEHPAAADELEEVLDSFALDANKALKSFANELVLAFEGDDDASEEAVDFLADCGHFFTTEGESEPDTAANNGDTLGQLERQVFSQLLQQFLQHFEQLEIIKQQLKQHIEHFEQLEQLAKK